MRAPPAGYKSAHPALPSATWCTHPCQTRTLKIKKIFVGGKAPKPPSRFNEVKMQDLIESSGETKTAIAVTVVGIVPAAVSRAEEVWIVVPRAAAQNTLRATAR